MEERSPCEANSTLVGANPARAFQFPSSRAVMGSLSIYSSRLKMKPRLTVLLLLCNSCLTYSVGSCSSRCSPRHVALATAPSFKLRRPAGVRRPHRLDLHVTMQP